MPPQEDKERLHQVARSERSPKNEEYPGGRQVLAVMYFHWHGTATATHHDPTPCQERATTCWPATQTHTHPHHTTHLDHTVGAHQASRQLKVRCVRGGDVAAAGHGGQKPPACKCKCHAFCNISHGHPQHGCPLKPRPCLPPPPPTHTRTNMQLITHTQPQLLQSRPWVQGAAARTWVRRICRRRRAVRLCHRHHRQ